MATHSTEPLAEMKACALRLLARREHSRHELLQKLRIRGYPESETAALLDEFSTAGWLSDIRFTQTYIDYRSQRGYGPLKIQQELRNRGVEASLITQALPKEELFWQTNLEQLWRKKFAAKKPTTDKARLQQLHFLQSRGFSVGQIQRLWTSTYE